MQVNLVCMMHEVKLLESLSIGSLHCPLLAKIVATQRITRSLVPPCLPPHFYFILHAT